jgi:hypothetical protein
MNSLRVPVRTSGLSPSTAQSILSRSVSLMGAAVPGCASTASASPPCPARPAPPAAARPTPMCSYTRAPTLSRSSRRACSAIPASPGATPPVHCPCFSNIARDRVAAATGIIVLVHAGHVLSCTGALIVADRFLTARHCLTDPTREDVRSASVTFDYATRCDGTRPAGHVTRFFKVPDEVLAPGPSSVPPPLRPTLSMHSTPRCRPSPAGVVVRFRYRSPA